ncbi:hypothetical protein [Virgibacillus sp. CBA3643]|uniref:hypothetical protein n=1 Tax=Virgibacillus sp. CBA3643 TaxID=2942278 RepID=UPI0035A2A8DE
MTYQEAKSEFKNILENQKTVEVTKLNELLYVLGISVDSNDDELEKIKEEMSMLRKDLKKVVTSNKK